MAVLSLAAASAAETVLMTKTVSAINYYGNEVGVVAYKGTTFLGFTWAAVSLMFVAAVAWVAEGFRRRKVRRGWREKKAAIH
jgi:phosphoribosylformylglycinamidine (FGAM) synthase-like enzyme